MTGQGKSAIDTLLAESFKELALKHPIEKITIKEITDKAGVIRPTFYNHFQDKYELLEWIIDTQLIAPAEPLIQNGMVNEALILLFSNIEKEKEFYQKAIHLEGQNSFESIAQSCIMKVFLRVFERSQPRRTKVCLADTGTYCCVLCTVHVLYCHELDSVRDDDLSEGVSRDL